VAALPRWEPETIACVPETINRKGLQVTKSLETSPALEVGGCAKLQQCFRNTKQVLGSFATR
jgi:hypothetical protein